MNSKRRLFDFWANWRIRWNSRWPKQDSCSEVQSWTDRYTLAQKISGNGQPVRKVHSKLGWTHPPTTWTSQQEERLDLGPQQRSAFEEKLSSPPALAIFDPSLETTLSADASSYGLGAVLTQRQTDGKWKPIVFISRALTPTERRYVQIEKEALATTWACERLADHLIGKKFLVETDHNPLVPILGSKNLEEMSPRIQRLRMRVLRFDFSVSHVPGKHLSTADALSRAPIVEETKENDPRPEEENNLYVHHIFNSLPASNTQLERIREKQEEDEVCQALKRVLWRRMAKTTQSSRRTSTLLASQGWTFSRPRLAS